MTLETSEERIKLLKSGFDGKQVEKLYLVLNDIEIEGVDWDEAAMKCMPENFHILPGLTTLSSMRVIAAPSQGARA